MESALAAIYDYLQLEAMGRLLLAVVLAGVLGLERETAGQAAGLRTHVLVSLGAACFTLVSIFGFVGFGTVQDPGRVAAQIVTGVGFLGAGAIWRSGASVRGLTTACLPSSLGVDCGESTHQGGGTSPIARKGTVCEMSTRRLTDAERLRWRSDGYLVVKGALSPDEVDRCVQAVDDLYERYVGSSDDGARKKGMGRRNIYAESDVFIDLIDHPGTFGLVLDLMGSYIGCSVAQATMRAPDPEFKGYIHPDGGEALEQIRVTESSLPLQVKIQYFLPDLPEPNMGNFIVFPGSQLRTWPEDRLPEGTATPGGVPLCVAAGDAVIFPHALWHGPGPNLSGRIRKTLIYRYNQLFMHPWDFDKAAPELLARCTPRQRRLLGDVGDWRRGTYYRNPAPADQAALMEGRSAD